MVSITKNLPDNLEELTEKVISLQESNNHFEVENNILREEVRLLRAQLFGRKTEKIKPGQESAQALLFDEAEEYSSAEEEVKEEVEVKAHNRKKRGRKPLPEDLPRVDKVHDLSEEEKVCACGCMKSRIGEETSEQLDIIPAKIQVIRHIRYKYVCKNCEGVEADEAAVKIAPAPKQMIPKSIATSGLLAHVLTSKFVDALPFYRQEKQFARLGVEIPRSTMCGWAIKVAERSMPLLEFIHRDILSGPLINIDETTVQVMKEPGRSNTTKSYMWVFRGGDPEAPVLLYQYHPTRSGSVASDFLKDYEGYVQTDGYSGYDFLDYKPGIIHVGCWTHARRNFVYVVKSVPKGKSLKGKKSRAEEAIEYIKKIYAIETNAKLQELSYEALYEERQKNAKPILEEFHSWLITISAKTPPQGLLGKAISYTLNQWDRLIKYLEDGRLKPDNNLVENAIRPFVVGRKNWLFAGRPEGASASSILYSLIETAKANGLEPYQYLRYLFEKLPHAEADKDYIALLPYHIEKEDLLLTQ
jgi:transposase